MYCQRSCLRLAVVLDAQPRIGGILSERCMLLCCRRGESPHSPAMCAAKCSLGATVGKTCSSTSWSIQGPNPSLVHTALTVPTGKGTWTFTSCVCMVKMIVLLSHGKWTHERVGLSLLRLSSLVMKSLGVRNGFLDVWVFLRWTPSVGW